jgi:hypothetical protein
METTNQIPPTLLHRLQINLLITPQASPWLPFPWPVQAGTWGLFYADPNAAEEDWAEGLLQMSLTGDPMSFPLPEASGSLSVLVFCWALNRVVTAITLDQLLEVRGYSPQRQHDRIVEHLSQIGSDIPPFAQVLLTLELLHRGISPQHQNTLKRTLGEDVLKAAYQMNRVCIDPDDQDRTLLQVQRIGLKLAETAETEIRAGIQTQLSGGQILR